MWEDEGENLDGGEASEVRVGGQTPEDADEVVGGQRHCGGVPVTVGG